MHDFCVQCWKPVPVPPEYSYRFGSAYCSKACHAKEQYFRAYYSNQHYVPVRR